jgi:hypothetical protein
MKFEKQVSLKWAIALVLIACLVSSSIVYYVFAVSPSSTFTISSGVYPGAPSYTFSREGSNYFAKDANGKIDYSGTNFTYVWQSAIDAIPSSGSGMLFFKAGQYVFDTKIVTSIGSYPTEGTPGNRNLKLIGEGGEGIDVTGTFTELKFTGTGAAIDIAPDSDFILEGFRCIGGNPFLNFKDSGGGRGHIHQISHNYFLNCTVAIKTGKSNPFMEIYRNRFSCTDKAIDWEANTDGNIEFNYFPHYPSKESNTTIYVHANNGFLTMFRNTFLPTGSSPDIKLECNNDGYIQIVMVEHNKFGADGLNGTSQTARIQVVVVAGTSNPVVAYSSFSYNTIANGAGSNSIKHFISYSGTTVTFTKVKVNENIILSGPNTGYLVDGGTSASSCRNEAIGNIKQEGADFLKIVNGTASSVDGLCQGFTVKYNKGYATENSGTANIITTSTVTFDHGLAGTPTHVECGFKTFGYGTWKWSATSTQITITVENSGTYTFSWYAEYKP